VNGYLLAFLLIGGFIALELILSKKGLLERYNMQLYGPFLMWKTRKGREFIDRVASKYERFWKRYADFGILLIFTFMFMGTALLIWVANIATHMPASSAPNPIMMLGIPGVNPIIPLWYGILGLAVAIIFHEFSHWILARVAKVRINSLGLLFFIFPVGAFVEPDEEETEKISKRKRMRIFAVGPTANIILAFVFLFLFIGMAGQVQPIEDGLVVSGVYQNGPADGYIAPGCEIIAVNGTEIDTLGDFNSAPFPPAGQRTNITILEDGKSRDISSISGLMITSTTEAYAASNAGIKAGMLIYSLNDTIIHNYDEFTDVLSNIKPGATVNISVYERSGDSYIPTDIHSITFTQDDKYTYYEKYFPAQNRDDFRGKAIMGVGVATLGINGFDAERIPQIFAHPLYGAHTAGEKLKASLSYISLPMSRLMPFSGPMTGLYTTGAFSFMPDWLFWVIANSMYWIFWLNLMVGITNALPAIPLDGGFMFKDAPD
jgi:membrane-associated protease RseP (regulator of RpoE activity)